MRHAPRVSGHLQSLIRRCHWALRRAAARVGGWWHRHTARIVEDQGYAEALAAVLVQAAELLVDSTRIREILRELAALLVAVLRALRSRPVPDTAA